MILDKYSIVKQVNLFISDLNLIAMLVMMRRGYPLDYPLLCLDFIIQHLHLLFLFFQIHLQLPLQLLLLLKGLLSLL